MENKRQFHRHKTFSNHEASTDQQLSRHNRNMNIRNNYLFIFGLIILVMLFFLFLTNFLNIIEYLITSILVIAASLFIKIYLRYNFVLDEVQTKSQNKGYAEVIIKNEPTYTVNTRNMEIQSHIYNPVSLQALKENPTGLSLKTKKEINKEIPTTNPYIKSKPTTKEAPAFIPKTKYTEISPKIKREETNPKEAPTISPRTRKTVEPSQRSNAPFKSLVNKPPITIICVIDEKLGMFGPMQRNLPPETTISAIMQLVASENKIKDQFDIEINTARGRATVDPKMKLEDIQTNPNLIIILYAEKRIQKAEVTKTTNPYGSLFQTRPADSSKQIISPNRPKIHSNFYQSKY